MFLVYICQHWFRTISYSNSVCGYSARIAYVAYFGWLFCMSLLSIIIIRAHHCTGHALKNCIGDAAVDVCHKLIILILSVRQYSHCSLTTSLVTSFIIVILLWTVNWQFPLLFQWWPSCIQCQLCHMTFSDQSAINAHYDTVHSVTENPKARFGCEVCDKKFTSKTSLKQHLAFTHSIGDAKTFQCDICSRVFNYKSHLTRHIKSVHAVQWQGRSVGSACEVR